MSFVYKYAPKTLSDLIMPSTSVRNKLDAYVQGKCIQPLILHGSYGVGKTTIAQLLPDAIEGKQAQVTTLKAMEFGSVYDVRDVFDVPPTYYKLFTTNDKRNYIVSNEFNFTMKAALAFRDVVDELYEHVQFIFTTNDLSRIDQGLQDRSVCLHIPPADAKSWLPRAKYIMQCEGVELSDAKLFDFIEKQLAVSSSNRKLLEKLEELVWGIKNPQQDDDGGDVVQVTITPPPAAPKAPVFNPLGAVMH